MIDHASLLESLVVLARNAGEVTLFFYSSECLADEKADGSPVTEADRQAESVILAGLCHLTPGISIVAEEAACADRTPACGAETFWLVDPLDGTREFLAGNGEFTVNVALIESGEPVLGVVLAPAMNVLWAGGRHLGAYCEDGAGRHALAARAPPAAGVTVLGSRSHGNDSAMAEYLRGRKVAGFEVAGSSLKFCLLAEGKADLYPRFGRTMEWDTAAGHAVLSAAGGRVCGLDGLPLRYGKPGFENPHFVASGRAPI